MSKGRWIPPDHLICVRCREKRDAAHLDRILWCERCCAEVRRRATLWGRLTGLFAALALVAWIALAVRPRFLAVWATIVVAAYWLGSKVSREIIYGVIRVAHRPGHPEGLDLFNGQG